MCRPAPPRPKPRKTYIPVPTHTGRVELWYTLGNDSNMMPVMASDLLKEFVKINLSKE